MVETKLFLEKLIIDQELKVSSYNRRIEYLQETKEDRKVTEINKIKVQILERNKFIKELKHILNNLDDRIGFLFDYELPF